LNAVDHTPSMITEALVVKSFEVRHPRPFISSFNSCRASSSRFSIPTMAVATIKTQAADHKAPPESGIHAWIALPPALASLARLLSSESQRQLQRRSAPGNKGCRNDLRNHPKFTVINKPVKQVADEPCHPKVNLNQSRGRNGSSLLQ